MKIIEGKENIISGYLSYLQDESKMSFGEIEYLAFPESEEDICQFLKFCREKNIPLTVSNGKTGVAGGAVPLKGAVISLEKLNKIHEVKKSVEEYRLRLEAGVTLDEIYQFLETADFADEKYFYPVDVTESSARIGGTVATNASGERSFKYGPTRTWVRSLRVVLPDGEIAAVERGNILAQGYDLEFKTLKGATRKIKIPRYTIPEIKSSAGYYTRKNMDLIDLFIGNEGTLGIISEVELALTKKPENILSLLAFFNKEEDALKFFFSARKELKTAMVFEYFDSGAMRLLRPKILELPENKDSAIFLEVEFNDSTLEEISSAIEKLLAENNSSLDNTWGGFEKKEIEKIRQIRHLIPETINETIAKRKQKIPVLHKISIDIAVPEEKFAEMITYYKTKLDPLALEYTMFGHIGENHLHLNILPREEKEFILAKDLHLDFAKKAVSLGGTVSAEHGIGKIKYPYLEVMYGKEGIRQMLEVKKALDPQCLLNRGNLFPEELLI